MTFLQKIKMFFLVLILLREVALCSVHLVSLRRADYGHMRHHCVAITGMFGLITRFGAPCSFCQRGGAAERLQNWCAAVRELTYLGRCGLNMKEVWHRDLTSQEPIWAGVSVGSGKSRGHDAPAALCTSTSSCSKFQCHAPVS